MNLFAVEKVNARLQILVNVLKATWEPLVKSLYVVITPAMIQRCAAGTVFVMRQKHALVILVSLEQTVILN